MRPGKKAGLAVSNGVPKGEDWRRHDNGPSYRRLEVLEFGFAIGKGIVLIGATAISTSP